MVIGNILINKIGDILKIESELDTFLGWNIANASASAISIMDILDKKRNPHESAAALMKNLLQRSVHLLYLRDSAGISHLFSATPELSDSIAEGLILHLALMDDGDESILEQALREQKQMTSELLTIANIMYLQTDAQYHFTDINHWAERSLATNRIDIIGAHISQLFTIDEKTLEMLEKALKDNGHYQDLEMRVLLPGDEEQIFLWNIKTFRLPNRSAAAIHFFGHNVTERKRMEAQLAQSEKLSAIGQMAAGVAHDIQKPLMSISSLVQMTEEFISDSFLKEKFGQIHNQIDYLSRTVRKLVDLSKPMSGDREWVNVNAIINEALRITAYDSRIKRIKIDQKLCSEIKAIWMNYDQLLQVFINILLNAADALLQKEKPHILIATECHITFINITIRDNGSGISPDILPRVFEPFFTAKKEQGGTGLGLWVCHNIIMNANGKIRLDSEPGKGTAVHITLPVKQES
jgi:two-component system, NtrC family, sensor kinase